MNLNENFEIDTCFTHFYVMLYASLCGIYTCVFADVLLYTHADFTQNILVKKNKNTTYSISPSKHEQQTH